MQTLTTENFSSFVQQDKAIVMFSSTWCGPCKSLKPILEKLEQTHPDITFGYVDIEKTETVTNQHRISGIPTTIFFKNNQICEKIIGMVPESKIEEIIQRVL